MQVATSSKSHGNAELEREKGSIFVHGMLLRFEAHLVTRLHVKCTSSIVPVCPPSFIAGHSLYGISSRGGLRPYSGKQTRDKEISRHNCVTSSAEDLRQCDGPTLRLTANTHTVSDESAKRN